MHAAQNRANRMPARQMPDAVQRVDHTGVGVAEQDNRSARGPKEEGLIITQRINAAAFRVLAESFIRLLLWVAAGNLAGEKEVGGYFRQASNGAKARTPFAQQREAAGRHANVSHARIGLPIFGLRGIAMDIDRDFRGGETKQIHQTTAVVISDRA